VHHGFPGQGVLSPRHDPYRSSFGIAHSPTTRRILLDARRRLHLDVVNEDVEAIPRVKQKPVSGGDFLGKTGEDGAVTPRSSPWPATGRTKLPMSGCSSLNICSGSRGSTATIQLAAGTDGGVVVDTVSWERGTDGRMRQEHSVARLSAREARRLRGLLGEALAVAELAGIDQPPLPYLKVAA
jgi:hypothetical protein